MEEDRSVERHTDAEGEHVEAGNVVRITGLSKSRQYNGTHGTIVSFRKRPSDGEILTVVECELDGELK